MGGQMASPRGMFDILQASKESLEVLTKGPGAGQGQSPGGSGDRQRMQTFGQGQMEMGKLRASGAEGKVSRQSQEKVMEYGQRLNDMALQLQEWIQVYQDQADA